MSRFQLKLLQAFWTGVLCLALCSSFNLPALAAENGAGFAGSNISRVLLISVDGLHSLDLSNYVRTHPNSALASLSQTGTTYTNASTSKPSDSFPGILAMTTGGTPNSTGVWYDDSYDRSLSAPGSKCATKGAEIVYDESIDKDSNALDGGGGIDPATLPLDPAKGCTPVYPHQFLRVNTIFEVIHQAGKLTAWSDKHPAYELLNGPSGKGVDDLYNPEIAANNSAATASINGVITYDTLKVNAILNEIDGKDHTGKNNPGVPAIFGMNFQAVSVGQKLTVGGYKDAQGTPTANLATSLDFVDQSLGKMVSELKKQGLYNSTAIVISAKHGQAPIDPKLYVKGGSKTIPPLVESVQTGLVAQATQDDVALLWLSDQSKTDQAVAKLGANQKQANIQTILSGDSLKKIFNDPTKDPRVPDIIVIPNMGVIYTNSTSKIAEHGGFNMDDTSVALLVSNPTLKPQTVQDAVQTTQIAPTILALLGLDPAALQAVQMEKTAVLPGLTFQNSTSTPAPVPALPLPNTGPDNAPSVLFPATGFSLSGPLLSFWNVNGGLPVFGYPIDSERQASGQIFQWFERNRLELHPENASPYNVLLGRLGVEALARKGINWQTLPKVSSAPPDCMYFAVTGHSLCGEFLAYWQSHGLSFDGGTTKSYAESLALFGYPISEPQMETNSSGDTVLSQWFERARLEIHPENPSPSRILLGRLGADLLGTSH
jgi:predicted AlkP superfamily pyrophosphatase or phosphodiesterase